MARSPELRRILKLIDFEDAVRLSIESCDFPLKVELVEVNDAVGRVLAEDVSATHDWPPSDQAFYDGYALSSADTKGASRERPVRLRIIGRVETVEEKGRLELEPGEAAFTPCGAPLPSGADCVLRIEEADVEGSYLIVKRQLRLRENVAPRGGDFRAGDALLAKGDVLRPQDVGLLMDFGRTEVAVYARPKVGIVPVGSDLDERKRRGSPYPDSYSRVAGMFLEKAGAEVCYFDIVRDDVEAVKAALLAAAAESDVVLAVAAPRSLGTI